MEPMQPDMACLSGGDIARQDDTSPESQETITTRAYQLEMLELALKGNIIVTMETGSGKTWCAKLRIEAELARRPDKLIWFTAPSVVLAEQQHDYLSRHLPSFSTRIITGSDNNHLWSTKDVWDAILDVNLIVTTPAVLLEGLEGGFLRLNRISLLVVDECHHCSGKNPSNKIMQEYYHPLRRAISAPELPCILGLTASPITIKLANMEKLEENLHAVCKAPTQQVEEYRRHVHPPELVTLSYLPKNSHLSLQVELILRIVDSIDIDEDPWMKQLLRQNTPKFLRTYDKVQETRSAYRMDQLQKLRSNTEHLYTQLGSWATNFWLRAVLLKLNSRVQSRDWLVSLSDEEISHLNQVLSEVRQLCCEAMEEGQIIKQVSSKVECLVQFLVAEFREDVRCVIFVERRSTAFALTKLLEEHPSIEYTITSFVGGSNSAKKDNLIDLADLATQKTGLAEFRAGKRSIVVATSVFEEGIDVSAMNLVIRWDHSPTIRSYIQSRGRARKSAAKFVTMYSNEELTSKRHTEWIALEAEMKARYSDEMRILQERLKVEDEDEEAGEVYELSSGAKLTYDNARNRLNHFTQSMRHVHFEPNARPTFSIYRGENGTDLSAKVVLPSSLPAELREVWGSGNWRTEQAAKKSAAFAAVKKIHQAGLINDHLLPPPMPKLDSHTVETRATFATIKPRVSPWPSITINIEQEDILLHVHRLSVENLPEALPSLLLLLPTKLGSFTDNSVPSTDMTVILRYTELQTLQAKILYAGTRATTTTSRALAQDVTLHLMQTSLASQTKKPESWKNGLPFYLLPDVPENELRGWFDFTMYTFPLANLLSGPSLSSKPHVALKHTSSHLVYTSHLERSDLTYTEPLCALPEVIPAVLARRQTKRIDYLNSNVPPSMAGQQKSLEIEECMVVQISPPIIEIMQFVPSVIYMIGSALISSKCCNELLQPFQITNEKLLIEALTSPLAYSRTNYERLEFFGDTLLKFYACLQVFAEPRNALLPEGYLTIEATNLVNNARLQRAAVEFGLDRFMIHEPFVPKKWKPETSTTHEEICPRKASTKVIADHVEALIAVAYLDEDCSGKDSKAIALLNGLLPEIQWTPPGVSTAAVVTDGGPVHSPSFEALSVVESILNYKFRYRYLLAEALNHSSVSTTVPTYGRLEFLGDAVLQRIVNEIVYKAAPRYSQNGMHLRQIACVSHSYLAFLCFEAWHEVDRVDIRTVLAEQKAVLEKTTERKYLWQFMTHSNAEIAPAQQRSLKRYLEYRDEIKQELEQSKTYPWALLASLAAPKFFSDIVESVLGAVFIDCNGNLEICASVLRKIGLTSLLQRLIDEPDMILDQPKTILWRERAKAGVPTLKAISRSRRDADGQRYNCQLLLDGEVYAEMDGAWCEDEAMLKACEVGLNKFRQEQKASKMLPEMEMEASQLSIEDMGGQKKRKREESAQPSSSSTVSDEE